MHVVHVVTRCIRGGAERHIAHVVDWEARNGHRADLVVGADHDPRAFPARAASVHVLPSLRRSVSPRWDPTAFVALRVLLRSTRPDVVHTHESKAGAVGRLAAVGIARAVAHTVHMPSFGPAYPPLASKLFLAVERGCARVTDVFVAVGDEIPRMYLAAGVGRPAAWHVVRSPVDVDRFTRLRDGIRSPSSAPGRAPLAFAMGRLEPRKRFALIVEQLAPLLRGGRLRLAIAGEGPELATIGELVERLGLDDAVMLLGYVDPERSFSEAAVFVHASLVEGVPQVVIQALAAGIPVVATEAPGLREAPGAAVTIVDRAGERLAEAVAAVLAAQPPPLPLDRLDPWRVPSIDAALEAVHGDLERVVAAKRRA